MTTIGYALFGVHNDTRMLEGCSFETCPACGYMTDFDFYNENYTPKKEFLDYSKTYDLYAVVSAKFRDFCLREGYGELRFRRFAQTNRHFCFDVIAPIVKFDAIRRETVFDKLCPTCGFYESVVGATPVFLKNPEELPSDGFARTDLCFASGNEKSPLILVGVETYKKMRKERFRGIEYEAIEV